MAKVCLLILLKAIEESHINGGRFIKTREHPSKVFDFTEETLNKMPLFDTGAHHVNKQVKKDPWVKQT